MLLEIFLALWAVYFICYYSRLKTDKELRFYSILVLLSVVIIYMVVREMHIYSSTEKFSLSNINMDIVVLASACYVVYYTFSFEGAGDLGYSIVTFILIGLIGQRLGMMTLLGLKSTLATIFLLFVAFIVAEVVRYSFRDSSRSRDNWYDYLDIFYDIFWLSRWFK
jgi:hypothetical protein